MTQAQEPIPAYQQHPLHVYTEKERRGWVVIIEAILSDLGPAVPQTRSVSISPSTPRPKQTI
jgi:hypothetical protein